MRFVNLIVLLSSIYLIKAQTPAPTDAPSVSPTSAPSTSPSVSPTSAPSTSPTVSPTSAPSVSPTASPTSAPSTSPSVSPTASPTPPTAAPTDAPSVSPTTSPTSGPTVSPTDAPSGSPTVSPTGVPSVSPTVSPTSGPTVSPTGHHLGVTHLMTFVADTTCGTTVQSSTTEADIYDCAQKCDDADTCDKFAFTDSSGMCKLFSSIGNEEAEEIGSVCCTLGDLAPSSSYTDTTTESVPKTYCNNTDGAVLDGLGLTVVTIQDTDFFECVSFCDTIIGCNAFEVVNGTLCNIYTGDSITGVEYDGADTSKKCYLNDKELMGTFVSHPGYECGSDLLNVITNTFGLKEYACHSACEAVNTCGGFEYISGTDSCFLYNDVTLAVFEPRNCYVRTQGITNVIGSHIGRLIFTEATWNSTKYLDPAFADYMEAILNLVLNKNAILTLIDGEDYGVVMDFTIDDEHEVVFDSESQLFIIEKVQDFNDPYSLGTQLVVGFNYAPTTNYPTISPTSSPTGAPTTPLPTLSPTQSPTEPASEIVHHFEVVGGKRCGVETAAFRDYNVSDVFECLSHCDNHPSCAQATFSEVNGTCALHSTNTLSMASEETKFCLKKEYVAPQSSYSLTEDTRCGGIPLFFLIFDDFIMDNADFNDCASMCNTYVGCDGFSLESGSCDFFVTYDLSADEVGTDCYLKDHNIASAYAGHENMGCGNDIIKTESNVDQGYHSCYLDCSNDNFCAGFEFYSVSNTCIYYSEISLSASTGKTCYSRSYGDNSYVGKHVGRLRFVDAVYDAGVHGTSTFKDYMESVIEYVIHKNITILFVIEGSVVVEYIVEDLGMTALGPEDTAHIRDKIAADGTYDLGAQLIGGSEPPPPTVMPSMAPTPLVTDSPTTAAPTTGTPTTASPTTASPTSPPTKSRGPFGDDLVVEVVVYTLLGIAGLLLLGSIFNIMYHLCTNTSGVPTMGCCPYP